MGALHAMGGHLKTTQMEPSAPYFIEGPDGMVNGHPCNKSNQAEAGDVFFGNWHNMIIGMRASFDLCVDTATLAASDGLVLRALQDVDVGIRHAASFTLGQNVQG
jgi:hypothetical protein